MRSAAIDMLYTRQRGHYNGRNIADGRGAERVKIASAFWPTLRALDDRRRAFADIDDATGAQLRRWLYIRDL